MNAFLAILAALPWKEIMILLLPILIMGAVQLIKRHKAELKPHLPWIAALLGAVLPPIGIALAAWLGVPVDFSPILIALGGAAGFTAVGMHQAVHQIKKRPRKGAG